MATYTKLKLSGSTDGKGILVTGVDTANTVTLHTAHATALDEVWLYAINTSSTATILLTIEWGEATAPNGNIQGTIPPQGGLVLFVPGLLLTNSLAIKAFAGTANVIVVHGFVNRIA